MIKYIFMRNEHKCLLLLKNKLSDLRLEPQLQRRESELRLVLPLHARLFDLRLRRRGLALPATARCSLILVDSRAFLSRSPARYFIIIIISLHYIFTTQSNAFRYSSLLNSTSSATQTID